MAATPTRGSDADSLPFVQAEALVDRFSGEERAVPAGALGQFLQPLLDDRILCIRHELR